MGKNNRARRAAKARTKARADGRQGRAGQHSRTGWPPPPRDDEPLPDEAEVAAGLLVMAAQARKRGDGFAARAEDRLGTLAPPVVAAEAECLLLDQLDAIWAGGWQPAELIRQVRRGGGAPVVRLVAATLATDHVRRRAATLDARWITQMDALDLPATDGGRGWVRRWTVDEGLDTSRVPGILIDALAQLTGLPRLRPLMAPPGSAGAGGPAPATRGDEGGEQDPVLGRIRALLAKAESTNFDEEADALTAKAQQLMTRHAIDHATVVAALAGTRGTAREEPVEVRIPVDDPYVDAKSLLLQIVAEHSRCRAVFHTDLALTTVVGFPTDVGAVELVFTSLLVQAQTALTAAARQAPPGTRVRSRSYRSAFLLSYAQRIGDRLAEINAAVVAEATETEGGSFLPVLRSRAAAVDDAMAARFGDLTRSTVRGGHDAAGWAGGRVAADNARLAADLSASTATG